MSGENSLLEMVKAQRKELPASAPSQPPNGEEGGEADQVDPEESREYKAYHFVNKQSSPEQFELISGRGNSRLVEYHSLVSMDYHPSHGILLTFVSQKILLKGKQLRPLVRYLQYHQIQWIAELNTDRNHDPGEGSVVTSIMVYSVGQDNVMALDEAIAAEINGFEDKAVD